jgi:hypothetical protein
VILQTLCVPWKSQECYSVCRPIKSFDMILVSQLPQDNRYDIIVRFNFKVQDDQKVYVHLVITIQKAKRKVQSVPRQSPDTY